MRIEGEVVFDRAATIDALDVVDVEITNEELDNAVDAFMRATFGLPSHHCVDDLPDEQRVVALLHRVDDDGRLPLLVPEDDAIAAEGSVGEGLDEHGGFIAPFRWRRRWRSKSPKR